MAVKVGEGSEGWGRLVEVATVVVLTLPAPVLAAQDTTGVRAVRESVSVRFVDADIRGVIQALGRYLPKPVLVGTIQPARVSLETPSPVPRGGVAALLKGLIESQNLAFTEDSSFFRVSTAPSRPLPPGGAGQGSRDTALMQLFVIRLK